MRKENIVSTILFLAVIIPLIANAQKLPNVQEKSLRAPASIKVDGKSTEWNNQFQAYNKNAEVFYTISNDNDKLYLTVQATNLDIMNKIIQGGIAFTINGSGKMKDQGGVTVTFPYLNIDRQGYHFERGTMATPPIKSLNMLKENSENSKELVDSFVVVFNKDLSSKAKDIKVEGIKEIPNGLVSIYNPEGFKATALVDNKKAFTYELAVPLKYLGISVKVAKPFVYNIKLTGMNTNLNDLRSISIAMRASREEVKSGGRGSITAYGERNGVAEFEGSIVPRLKELFSPTDFSGEYILAK